MRNRNKGTKYNYWKYQTSRDERADYRPNDNCDKFNSSIICIRSNPKIKWMVGLFNNMPTIRLTFRFPDPRYTNTHSHIRSTTQSPPSSHIWPCNTLPGLRNSNLSVLLPLLAFHFWPLYSPPPLPFPLYLPHTGRRGGWYFSHSVYLLQFTLFSCICYVDCWSQWRRNVSMLKYNYSLVLTLSQ